MGKKATFIAQLAGIDVPPATKLLIVQASEISEEEPFALEKLCPVLTLYQAASFFQALDMAEQLLQLRVTRRDSILTRRRKKRSRFGGSG